jgi:uncharacterized protein
MDYQMISADDHLDLQYLPTNLWTERLPKALRDRAPHIEEREGGAVWVCDGEVWGRWAGTRRPTSPKALFNAFDRGGVDETERRPAQAALRLADMDRDGCRGASHVRACGRHGDRRSSPAHCLHPGLQ